MNEDVEKEGAEKSVPVCPACKLPMEGWTTEEAERGWKLDRNVEKGTAIIIYHCYSAYVG